MRIFIGVTSGVLTRWFMSHTNFDLYWQGYATAFAVGFSMDVYDKYFKEKEEHTNF